MWAGVGTYSRCCRQIGAKDRPPPIGLELVATHTMGKGTGVIRLFNAVRPLAAVVGDVLRCTPNAPAVTDERLEAWRSDPEIIAFLSGILRVDLILSELMCHAAPARDRDDGDSNRGDYNRENNVASLLDCTTRLTELNLGLNPERRERSALGYTGYDREGLETLFRALNKSTS
ncbi:MAG: hypothetical protein ACPIOQ_28440, partial [Promethearchaeia archaeon]